MSYNFLYIQIIFARKVLCSSIVDSPAILRIKCWNRSINKNMNQIKLSLQWKIHIIKVTEQDLERPKEKKNDIKTKARWKQKLWYSSENACSSPIMNSRLLYIFSRILLPLFYMQFVVLDCLSMHEYVITTILHICKDSW